MIPAPSAHPRTLALPLALGLGLAALAMGCAAPPPAAEESDKLGARGALRFSLDAPALREGENALEVAVLEATSRQGVTHALVVAEASMPSMHHAPEVGVVTDLGEGRYAVEGLVFSMPGTWRLHIEATRDTLEDETTFDLDVP
jgi:hypothetical protein